MGGGGGAPEMKTRNIGVAWAYCLGSDYTLLCVPGTPSERPHLLIYISMC